MNRALLATLAPLTLAAVARAATPIPPSSVLTGPEGTLRWTVSSADDGVHVEGSSPRWSVKHRAKPDLTPVRTERTDETGTVVVTYSAEGATVVRDGKTIERERADLWDADTLDLRLGSLSVAGPVDVRFHALDPASGKVYEFQATDQGQGTCGPHVCHRVQVKLAGLLAPLGPTFVYGYAPDGRLLSFSGPIGDFQAKE